MNILKHKKNKNNNLIMKIKKWKQFNESFDNSDKLSSAIWNAWEKHFGWVYDEDEEWMDKIEDSIKADDNNLYNNLTYLIDVNGGPIGEESYHIFIENLEEILGMNESISKEYSEINEEMFSGWKLIDKLEYLYMNDPLFKEDTEKAIRRLEENEHDIKKKRYGDELDKYIKKEYESITGISKDILKSILDRKDIHIDNFNELSPDELQDVWNEYVLPDTQKMHQKVKSDFDEWKEEQNNENMGL